MFYRYDSSKTHIKFNFCIQCFTGMTEVKILLFQTVPSVTIQIRGSQMTGKCHQMVNYQFQMSQCWMRKAQSLSWNHSKFEFSIVIIRNSSTIIFIQCWCRTPWSYNGHLIGGNFKYRLKVMQKDPFSLFSTESTCFLWIVA